MFGLTGQIGDNNHLPRLSRGNSERTKKALRLSLPFFLRSFASFAGLCRVRARPFLRSFALVVSGISQMLLFHNTTAQATDRGTRPCLTHSLTPLFFLPLSLAVALAGWLRTNELTPADHQPDTFVR